MLVAVKTFEVLIALDRPESAAAIRAPQIMTTHGILRIEEPVLIFILGKFRPAFDRPEVNEVYKLS